MNIFSLTLFIITLINNSDFNDITQIFSVILSAIPLYLEVLDACMIRGLYFKIKFLIAGTVVDLFKNQMIEINRKSEFMFYNNNFFNGCCDGNIIKMYLDQYNDLIIYHNNINELYKFRMKNDEHYFSLNTEPITIKDHTLDYMKNDKNELLIQIKSIYHKNVKTYVKVFNVNQSDLEKFIKKDIYMHITNRTKYLDGVAHKLNFYEKICLHSYNSIYNLEPFNKNDINKLFDDKEKFYELIIPFLAYFPLACFFLSLFPIYLLFVFSAFFIRVFRKLINDNEFLRILEMSFSDFSDVWFIVFNHRKTGYMVMGF